MSIRARGVLGSAVLALCLAADALGQAVPERLVKAGLVYNIAKLTEWPDDAFPSKDAPLSVCLMSEANRYGNVFAAIDNKPVHGRTLRVKHGVKLSELKTCQLVFLNEEDQSLLPAVVGAVRGLPVLTISEIEDFAETGGMVALFLEDERMQFKVNAEAAARARLQISSQLLRMARIVKARP